MKKLFIALSLFLFGFMLTSCNFSVEDAEDLQVKLNMESDVVKNWALKGMTADQTIDDLYSHEVSFTYVEKRREKDENGKNVINSYDMEATVSLTPSAKNERTGDYWTVSLPKDASNVRGILTNITEDMYRKYDSAELEYQYKTPYLSTSNPEATIARTQIIQILFGTEKNPIADQTQNILKNVPVGPLNDPNYYVGSDYFSLRDMKLQEGWDSQPYSFLKKDFDQYGALYAFTIYLPLLVRGYSDAFGNEPQVEMFVFAPLGTVGLRANGDKLARYTYGYKMYYDAIEDANLFYTPTFDANGSLI